MSSSDETNARRGGADAGRTGDAPGAGTRTRAGRGADTPPGSARGRRKTPDERRAEIASAARELALTDGLSAVTLRAVAAKAGVTPALVAHYRPTMDALVAETFAEIVSAELREIAHVRPGDRRTGVAADAAVGTRADPSAAERLGALVATLLDGSRDDVTLVWVEAWALGRRNETLAASVREQMDAWHEVLRELIADGRHAGEFEVDDPAAVAWQLLGMIDGLNAQALVRWGEGRSVLIARALEGMLGLPRGALADDG
jgi:AcrR family transcriptional regulator